MKKILLMVLVCIVAIVAPFILFIRSCSFFINEYDIHHFLSVAASSVLGSLLIASIIKLKVNLDGTQIKSLGCLTYIRGYLSLSGTQVLSLENLEYVGIHLFLGGSQVRDLGNLDYVGGKIYTTDGTFIEDFRSHKKEADTYLKEIRYEDYPLHMNHKNLMIRTKINNYLETGVAS